MVYRKIKEPKVWLMSAYHRKVGQLSVIKQERLLKLSAEVLVLMQIVNYFALKREEKGH